MKSRTIGLALMVSVASSLSAQMGQGHRGGDGDMSSEEMGGMMQVMQRFAPDAILDMADQLALSADQRSEITAILERRDSVVAVARAAHTRHRDQLMEVVDDVDVAEGVVVGHMTGAHDAMGSMHRAQMLASIRVRAVLTADQRSQVPMGRGMGDRHDMNRNR